MLQQLPCRNTAGMWAVGAMTILTSVMQFAMLPLQGLGQGAQPIISYNYGAGDAGRVRGAFRLLLKVSLGYATLLWLLVMLLPGGFAAMFTSDAALLDYTMRPRSDLYGGHVPDGGSRWPAR